MSSGEGEFARCGWFGSAYELTANGLAVVRIERLGNCTRGWVVDAADTLDIAILLLVGLVYHTIARREASEGD